MKLADLIRKGSLTEPDQYCSKSSNCSCSNTLEGSQSVASTLINKINKSSSSSNCSYTYPLNGEDKAGTHKPAATATPATPATPAIETRPLPYLDLDGSIVIPFGSDSRYQWWKGGQSIVDTMKEITP